MPAPLQVDIKMQAKKDLNTYTTNMFHFPPRGILKIGGGNFGTFSKVDQTVPN